MTLPEHPGNHLLSMAAKAGHIFMLGLPGFLSLGFGAFGVLETPKP